MPPVLSPYQEEAVAEIVGNETMPHRYLADEQGLGKTIEAIACLIRWFVRVGMIVCPASAIGVWQREIRIWWPECAVLTPRRAAQLMHSELRKRHSACLILLSYDLLSRYAAAWVKLAQHLKLDALVCDEAHRLKADRSLRTKAVFGAAINGHNSLVAGVPHVLLLSGTPMTAYVADLWPALHALWPDRLWYGAQHRKPMSQNAFESHFCDRVDDGFGLRPVGNRNMAELRMRLYGKGQPVFIRRTKRDVLKDLPPCRFVLTPLTPVAPDGPPAMFPPELANVPDDQLDAWITANATTVNSATARRALGDYKLAAALAWIIDWLDDNPDHKLIVFAVHRHVLETIHASLEKHRFHPVLLHGGTRPQDRAQLIEDFQTLKTHRVFVGQLLAAGESITLHAASTVVFVETDWSHAALAQAMSRAHRRGQNEAVLGHVLIVPNSLDERIHATAVRKAQGITKLWGGTEDAGPTDHPVREHGGAASGVDATAG